MLYLLYFGYWLGKVGKMVKKIGNFNHICTLSPLECITLEEENILKVENTVKLRRIS